MRKNKGKRFGTLMLSLCVSAVIFAAGSLQSFAYTETTGTVSQDNVKVRESASTTATQVSSLKIGDNIEIVDEATDASGYVWYKIRVNKNEYGYVRSDLVSKAGGSSSTTTSSTTEANAAAASLPATTVTSTDQKTATAVDNCKVRSGAGTGYDQVGNLTKGDSVTITGEATGSDNKTWYQISYGTSGKNGFVRSDLVNVVESAPVEVQEVAEPAEGENPEVQEGAEGENAEVAEQEATVQETTQVGDGAFELKYEDDTWYLYDYEKEQRVQVRQLIEVAEQVPSLTKQAGTYKTVIIGLAIAIAALVIGVIILVLKLRDSMYYEDEDEEEEYDRYASSGRRNRAEENEDAPRARRKLQEEDDEDDEEEEEEPRKLFRKNSSEDREFSKPSRQERKSDDKPVRGASRRSSDDDRTVRPERSAEDRPSRSERNSDDRQSRRSRRDGKDERQDRRSEERASRRIRQAEEEEERTSRPSRRDNSADESPRRRAKNFIGDDDDFEFEFLDLDD